MHVSKSCRWIFAFGLVVTQALAAPLPNLAIVVFVDRDADGVQDADEQGVAGVKLLLDDGRLLLTDAQGRAHVRAPEGSRVSLIKPPGYRLVTTTDALPLNWRKFGADTMPLRFGLLTDMRASVFDVLLFGDPQPKSLVDVDYYRRDIVEPLRGRHQARFGLSLGDIVNDVPELYSAMNAVTARLGIPWLHIAGNHDVDVDAVDDAGSLRSFESVYGPDTFAWEEHGAAFVGLDDVIARPGQTPAYIGGLRDAQFVFLAAYLPTVPVDDLLVLAVHIPLFDTEPGRETFRRADRERLFALLAAHPNVLLLSAHGHVQRQFLHGAAQGWHGPRPLHEYNMGAACGAFWSGRKDAQGIPDTIMADGTPNGYALLHVEDGHYRLRWYSARSDDDVGISLHAPKVLRRNAWPGVFLYANVYMAMPDARVQWQIDDGPWQPMAKVDAPDPRVLAINLSDDAAEELPAYDRTPQAVNSTHLWRAVLPTTLAPGPHRLRVRTFDPWRGELQAQTVYRLIEAQP